MNDDTRLSQLAENHRFFGDMRFKQLTLFMAAMTTAAAGVMQFPGHRWWIALSALFVTAVMWVIEVRAALNGIAAHKAIPELFPTTTHILALDKRIMGCATAARRVLCHMVMVHSHLVSRLLFLLRRSIGWHHAAHLLGRQLPASERFLAEPPVKAWGIRGDESGDRQD